MRKTLGILIAAMVLLNAPTAAEAYTINEMGNWCEELSDNIKIHSDSSIRYDNTRNNNICYGAFAAIQQLTTFVDKNQNRLLSICTPSESTLTQMVSIFVKYAKEHPEKGHLPFTSGAILALNEAFPCE